MENCLSYWHAYPYTARAILNSLLIFVVTACGSVPRESAVLPPPFTPIAAATAPAENASVSISQSQLVDTEVRSSMGTEIEKAAKSKPVVHALTPKQKPSHLVEKPSQAPVATPVVTIPQKGSAAYYIPKQMVEKMPSLVDLWIDRTTSIDQLKRELAAQLKITYEKINVRHVLNTDEKSGVPVLEQIDGVEIPIGANMVAELRGGEDFSIDPKGPVSRSLLGDGRAKWNWRVTPKHASTDGILIDLDIWIDPGSGKPWNDSYHESVIVHAIPLTWYEELYKLAQDLNAWLALLGIGGIGGLIKWIYSKRKGNLSGDQA